VFGPRTRAAMLAYQRAQSLSEGHLTRETVTRLGVAFRP
jgi:peptidoglycan hydrolase-like protein with peptidoglycan-binding domain